MRRAGLMVLIFAAGLVLGAVGRGAKKPTARTTDYPVRVLWTRLRPPDGQLKLYSVETLSVTDPDRPDQVRTVAAVPEGEPQTNWEITLVYPDREARLLTRAVAP